MTPFLKNVSPRTLSIIGASCFSVLLVFSAYVTSGPNIFFKTKVAGAESTDALLKAYAAKDSDNDNLPDWQESLYGTDPNNPHSIDPVLTDGEAVAKGLVKPKFASDQSATATTSLKDALATIPGQTPAENTVTAQFAKAFLQQYADTLSQNGGQPLTDADKEAVIAQLMPSFAAQAQNLVASSYTAVSVHTSSTETLSQYAASVEAILRAHDVKIAANADPVMLMQSLVVDQNESARPKVKALAAAYSAIATDLANTSVPASYAADHLALMQSFDSLGKATKLVSIYETDPAALFGTIATYRDASAQVGVVFNDLATALLTQGEPAAGQPGSLLLGIVRSVQKP